MNAHRSTRPGTFPRCAGAIALCRVGALAGLLGLAFATMGCGGSRSDAVVIYAAQDRVFAEPVLREFTRQTGLEVRAVYDNEATKTTGLVQRLIMEASRPQADLWWSNEGLRTRQLVARGLLEPDVTEFGRRERVWVTRTGGAVPESLGALTNEAWRGRLVMAYPVFGSTANHLLVLRQRWGSSAWTRWCTALAGQRPLLVEGNSQVVRVVARGDAAVGLTDSDDVAFARREGLDVVAQPLPAAEGFHLPNTVAVVAGARNAAGARRLADYLAGPAVLARLREAGAVDPAPVSTTGEAELRVSIDGKAVPADLDATLETLAKTFVRGTP